MSAETQSLAEEIDALSPPARLRLAADLLDAGRGDVAHSIAARVVTELGAALALAELQCAGKRGGPR